MPLRQFSPSEVLVTERRRLERPLLAMVWLATCSFSAVDGQILYAAMGTLAVGLNLWAVQGDREIFLSRRIVNVAVLLATAALVVELLLVEWPTLLTPLGHYLILIQLCKLFERKGNRDYVQIIAVSGLVMVASLLMCPELWLALAMLAFVTLSAHVAMVLTLKRGLDAALAEKVAGEKHPLAPQQVAWNVTRQWPRRALAGRLASAMAAMLAFGAAMFLLSPRMSGSTQMMDGPGSHASITGFSTTVSLREPGSIYTSDQPVMQVKVYAADPQGPAAPSDLYLRGLTYDTYEASAWATPRRPPASPQAAAPPLPPELADSAIVQEASMSMDLQPTLFAMGPCVAIASPDAAARLGPDLNPSVDRVYSAPGQLVRYTALSLPTPLTPQARLYVQELEGWCDLPPALPSSPADAAATQPPPPQDDARQEPGRQSIIPPAVARLAAELCVDLLAARNAADAPRQRDELDLAIARRLAGHLRTEYAYSLDFTDADPRRDGVEDFLFHMKHGHCEYFATALTVMCQSLGVRARLATGFHVDGESRIAGVYIIRQRDAHAWTEVYTPSSGWQTFDATPAGSSRASRGGFWQQVSDFWSALKFAWLSKVVGYDASSQKDLAGSAAAALRAAWRAVMDFFQRLGDGFRRLLVEGEVDVVLVQAAALLGVAGLVLEGVILVRLWRRRKAQAAEAAKGRHLRFIRSLLELLARHGIAVDAAHTPRELSARAAEALALPRQTLDELIALYYALRWGGVPPAQGEVAAAEQKVAQMAATLQKPPR
jgi:transglutaminase-like putative cysteine protease